MQAEIIIFILICLAVAAGLVFATYWLTRVRWQNRLDMARSANSARWQSAAQEDQSKLDKAVAAAQRRIDQARSEGVDHANISWKTGIEEGKRILASANAKAYDQKEVLGLALAVSHRGRVRVRIVAGDGGHHLLLHSPAGYKNKARASELLERIQQARLVRVEDITTQ